MIDCIFTIDYEIYGNGSGSLTELVYRPTEALLAMFSKSRRRLVIFVEVSELEMIETNETDSGISLIQQQLRAAHAADVELGLHLHPWWYNARHEAGSWILDYNEYNLCALPRERIVEIVDRSMAYLRKIVGLPGFAPFSYRAGHLLFQPTPNLAAILSERGIRVDSSVYKGGLWHQHKLDYRPARRNGYYWKFSDSTNVPDPKGVLLELPIYTASVPAWRMLTAKRINLRKKGSSAAQAGRSILSRSRDYFRLSYPLKLDFCSMTIEELTATIGEVVREDRLDPNTYRPIVLIGHTKDLVDLDTIELLLAYLDKNGLGTSTLKDAHNKCIGNVD